MAAEAEVPYPTLTSAEQVLKLRSSNSDPLKNWADSIGVVNSPDSGLSGETE